MKFVINLILLAASLIGTVKALVDQRLLLALLLAVVAVALVVTLILRAARGLSRSGGI